MSFAHPTEESQNIHRRDWRQTDSFCGLWSSQAISARTRKRVCAYVQRNAYNDLEPLVQHSPKHAKQPSVESCPHAIYGCGVNSTRRVPTAEE